MASGMENNYMKVNWNCSCKWTGKLRRSETQDLWRLWKAPSRSTWSVWSHHTDKSAITLKENTELETTWQSQFLAECTLAEKLQPRFKTCQCCLMKPSCLCKESTVYSRQYPAGPKEQPPLQAAAPKSRRWRLPTHCSLCTRTRQQVSKDAPTTTERYIVSVWVQGFAEALTYHSTSNKVKKWVKKRLKITFALSIFLLHLFYFLESWDVLIKQTHSINDWKVICF